MEMVHHAPSGPPRHKTHLKDVLLSVVFRYCFMMDFTKPQVLPGWAHHWPAMERWTPAFFKNTYGDVTVAIKRSRSGERREITVREYFDTIHSAAAGRDAWYLSDWQLNAPLRQLRADYEVPPQFRCWTETLPEEQQPSLRWLYIGPAGSGKRLHVDVMATAAWNVVISGHKRWRFYTPDQLELLYGGAVDVFAPDLDRFPRFAKAEAVELDQRPGDLVYTPSGWWHQVENLEAGISVTENFVNEIDAEAVYLELVARGETRWLELFASFRPVGA